MGQMVYVLVELQKGKEGNEWFPVAVVTDATVAEQWQQYGKDVSWVPLELDDVKYLQPGTEKQNKPQFQPREMSSIEQRAVETAQKLEETNQRLLKIIERLQKQLGVKGKVPVEDLKQEAAPVKSSSLFDEED